jgi:hypothetical protein
LKELALRQILQDLSKYNIIQEAFSKFTSWSAVILVGIPKFSLFDRYPQLRELEIRELARMLLSEGSSPDLWLLDGEIHKYTCGQLPHAKHVISTLYELMESDEPVEEIPIPVATPSIQQTHSVNWPGLKKALTSSLTSGTFLDSQFYAIESRSSTGLPKIRPIYFSSMVSDSLMSKLTECKPLLRSCIDRLLI